MLSPSCSYPNAADFSLRVFPFSLSCPTGLRSLHRRWKKRREGGFHRFRLLSLRRRPPLAAAASVVVEAVTVPWEDELVPTVIRRAEGRLETNGG